MTTAHVPAAGPVVGMRSRRWSLRALLVPPATAIAIAGATVLLLMTPMWTHLALDLSGGSRALPTPQQAYALSDRTVIELLLGPGTFAPFPADEAAHMRDVRVVLLAFLTLTAASFVYLAVAQLRWRGQAWLYRAHAHGARLLIVVVLTLGVVGALAFGLAFELFHRILFPGGNWAFAADSLLIRLYPYAFWQLSAAAFGVLAVVIGLAAWLLAARRAGAVDQK